MPIIVQTADEDSADEAALLARIVALETAVTGLQTDLTAANTALTAIQSKVGLYDALVAALRDVLEAA